MKKLALYFLLAGFGMQSAAHGQVPNPEAVRPAPGFTLTLSEQHSGSIVPPQRWFVVKLTNISNEVMHRTSCDSFGEIYNLEVVYNGVPMKKTAAELEWKKQHEAGGCTGSVTMEATDPGHDRFDTLAYNTLKPGTYEFTLIRETFPGEPEKSVTVKSNTITIVVKPEDLAPK
jgi:hypothetical protein